MQNVYKWEFDYVKYHLYEHGFRPCYIECVRHGEPHNLGGIKEVGEEDDLFGNSD